MLLSKLKFPAMLVSRTARHCIAGLLYIEWFCAECWNATQIEVTFSYVWSVIVQCTCPAYIHYIKATYVPNLHQQHQLTQRYGSTTYLYVLVLRLCQFWCPWSCLFSVCNLSSPADWLWGAHKNYKTYNFSLNNAGWICINIIYII